MDDREQARTELAEKLVPLLPGAPRTRERTADYLLADRALVLRALGMEQVETSVPLPFNRLVWVEPPPDSGAET